ncbi:unnamed protein product [Urochloa decumbens]|uniref:F-box domain-containing protein n=1 Tax=Urochloa decumbens TaxID=240449 RepID=A0ABC9GES4_9POAL
MARPSLMEELEEEILLRFPPHEPALLFRASLVCKRWRRLVSGPGFRRRFRELHRAPPMLGLLCSTKDLSEGSTASAFVATASFCSGDLDLGPYRPLDARHGRVLLLQCSRSSDDVLVVWDPMTSQALELPVLDRWRYTSSSTAAVLCAARGPCNHLDCHRGPFLVVYVGSGAFGSGETFICTYSSDAGTWSEPITTELPLDFVGSMSSVLVGNALYFGFLIRKSLLRYDLESHEMSVIGVPQTFCFWQHVVLDGGLALATVQEGKLCIWRKAGPEVDVGWTQDRAIELETLLPADASFAWPRVVGFADGVDVIFLRAVPALFTIDLKTYKVKKVYEGKNVYSAIPYMSFYTPGTILLGFWFCNFQNE